MDENGTITRRGFLTLMNAAYLSASAGISANNGTGSDTISFGVITDLHYAYKPANGTRYYRDSLEKLTECIDTMNNLKPVFLIQIGDLIDAGPKEIEIGYLNTIDRVFRSFSGERYHVLGNHDLATFSKNEFLTMTGGNENYYSFDYGQYHFIVLDGNYTRDGSDYNAGNFDWTDAYIHSTQQEWLKQDLAQTHDKTTIVFVHQNLHDNHDEVKNRHCIGNAGEIRQILEHAGTVRAVFQGHDHEGAYTVMNGIHYLTFPGAVEGPGLENNSYALVKITENEIQITGFGKQKSYLFAKL